MMLKTMLKYVACVAGPAIVLATVVSAIVTRNVYGDLPSPSGASILHSKLPLFLAMTLAGYVATCAGVLTLAMLIRRLRWPLAACFAAAWALTTLAHTGFTVATVAPAFRGHVSWLAVLPTSAVVVGIQTVAVALVHVWLLGGRPKPLPEAVF